MGPAGSGEGEGEGEGEGVDALVPSAYTLDQKPSFVDRIDALSREAWPTFHQHRWPVENRRFEEMDISPQATSKVSQSSNQVR